MTILKDQLVNTSALDESGLKVEADAIVDYFSELFMGRTFTGVDFDVIETELENMRLIYEAYQTRLMGGTIALSQ